MPFVKMPGVTGLVYVPEDSGKPKKHDCPDCIECQWCSDSRCELCLHQKQGKCKKGGKCRKKKAAKKK